jgi:hypothetical protein
MLRGSKIVAAQQRRPTMENMRIKRKYIALVTAVVLLSAYVGAFLIVHTSDTLRKPAANMAYYYYSDNPVMEKVEFYGFWPLRQVGYHVPGFEMRHNDERVYPDIKNAGM